MKTSKLFNSLNEIVHSHIKLLERMDSLTTSYRKQGILSERLAQKQLEETQTEREALKEFSKKSAHINALIVAHNEKPCCHTYKEIQDNLDSLKALLIIES